jgi:threonine dehydrogenase-like Zn-dependent dehydrogenase
LFTALFAGTQGVQGLARQFGVDEVIDPAAHDMVAAIRELTHGEGAHKTLDASSAPDARAAAVRSVRSSGTACFVGERGQVTLDVSADLLRRQVTLVGSWTFSKQGGGLEDRHCRR